MTAAIDRPGWLAARRLVRGVLRPLAAARGFRVVGRQRLPRQRRSLLIVCNHAALVDSLYMTLAIRPRFAICGARPVYFDSPGKRMLMALANIAAIEDRDDYLAKTLRLLCTGGIVVTYPEMARNADAMGELRTWAAEAALTIGAPILPCYLYGTTRGQTAGPRLFVGRELEPSGDALDLTVHLRAAIIGLAPRELPGAPSCP